MKGRFPGHYRVGAALLAAFLPLSSSAQVQPCPCVVSGICCQCADGSSKQVDLSPGIAPWMVAVPGSTAFQPVIGAFNAGWTATLPGAVWVGPPGAPHTPGNYTYTLQYKIPQCVIPAPVTLTVQFAADNSATIPGSVAVAGTFNVPGPVNVLPPSFTAPAGFHTLTVVVNNSASPPGPTGLLLKATLTTHCPLQQPTGSNAASAGTAQS